ncbi:phosphopantetheine-binding protein [Dactylosporangium sp. CS-033363]|uniref:phosphopantetheine-binding protein n=1 Tax=unclassified Dactylosporangium TaxID=2621675 RepID=UPI003D8DCE4D
MSGSTTDSSVGTVNSSVEQIWCAVLGVAPGPSDETFLDLGGQSISAMLIATRVRDELGVDIEIGDLFDDPTLASLQETVRAKHAARG